MKILWACVMMNFFIYFGSFNSYAQQTTEQPSASTTEQPVLIITPFPISLELINEAKDDKGTDVSNIYNLTVNFADPIYANDNLYTIMYFVDDRPLEEFKGQRLPYSLKRNYKGLEDGDHQVKIDVEDGKGNVLATKTATVHVHHDIGSQ